MLSADYVRTLFAYSSWATGRLLAAAAGMTPEELAAAPIAAHGSIIATLAHTLGAEIVWRERLEGRTPAAMLGPHEVPSLEALRTAWAAEEGRWRERLAALDDAALATPVTYTSLNGKRYTQPLWQILAHLANHGTQHRAEAAAMLTILGRSPGDLDMILFFRERGV